MTNKITLITPPDIYENSNLSVMFLGMDEKQQEQTSHWLAQHNNYPECNLYYYQNENNLTWLFYALNRSDYKFLNLDGDSSIITLLGSYILGRPNVFYTTKNQNIKELMSYINNQFVPSVDDFLERVFNAK